MSLTGMTKLLSPIQLAGLTPETSASNNMSMCAQDTVPEGRATQALHGATYTPRTLASATGGANVSTCNAPMGIADHLHGMQDNSVAEGRNAGWRESLLTPAYTPGRFMSPVAGANVSMLFVPTHITDDLHGTQGAHLEEEEDKDKESGYTSEDMRSSSPDPPLLKDILFGQVLALRCVNIEVPRVSCI